MLQHLATGLLRASVSGAMIAGQVVMDNGVLVTDGRTRGRDARARVRGAALEAHRVSASAARPGLRELLTLAWPVVLSRSTQAVVGLADALMSARLGDTALAAVSTGAVNLFSVAVSADGHGVHRPELRRAASGPRRPARRAPLRLLRPGAGRDHHAHSPRPRRRSRARRSACSGSRPTCTAR
jgi:hypothetical protein